VAEEKKKIQETEFIP